jgi:hypothetical protein
MDCIFAHVSYLSLVLGALTIGEPKYIIETCWRLQPRVELIESVVETWGWLQTRPCPCLPGLSDFRSFELSLSNLAGVILRAKSNMSDGEDSFTTELTLALLPSPQPF